LRVGRQGAYQKYCQRQELQKTDWELVHGDPLFRLAGPCLRVGLTAAEMSAGLYIDSRQLSCGKNPPHLQTRSPLITAANYSRVLETSRSTERRAVIPLTCEALSATREHYAFTALGGGDGRRGQTERFL
jgi:hypothetical protein